MSRQRSRFPLHSRTSTQLGRQDGYYGEQYHATVHSDPWRGSESVDSRHVEGGVRWDNESSKAEEQVDHWAKFIEAIDRAVRHKSSSMSKYPTQDGIQNFEEDPACGQRQLARERLSSSEALHYNLEMHDRIRDPGLRRSEHNVGLVDQRYSRSSSPKHSHGKRYGRMEHGYNNEEHERRYERSSYNERSMKSNLKEHQLHIKEFQDLDPQEEYTVSHISPHFAPVIVEHDHGIQKHARIHSQGRDRERHRSHDSDREHGRPRNHDPGIERERPRSRDLIRDRERPRIGNLGKDREHSRNRNVVSQREHLRSLGPSFDKEYPRSSGSVGHQENLRSHDRDQEHQRSRDPLRARDLSRDRDISKRSEPVMSSDTSRGKESSKTKESRKHGRDYNRHQEIPHDSFSRSSNYHIRKDSRSRAFSAVRGSPLQDMRHNKEQPRMGSHPREPHKQRAVDDEDFRMDDSNISRASVHDWEEETQLGGVLGEGNILEGNPQHRSPNHSGAIMDLVGHETLKIKVDMSRPLHQSSHLGYSPERQLSFDLVNVGRQRLDFLPMLEHSGTIRETPVHSGTFAQEIITLVHHVKENYFQGPGITLNERFSNEQEYSLVDNFAEEQEEVKGVGPIINRPLGSTSLGTQVFCKIGSIQSQPKPHIPAPGDLRHDLERKRQERLEGVKITIAGGNFSQILPQSQEKESVYVDEAADWSKEVPQRTELWENPHPKRPIKNVNTRRNFTRRSRLGSRMKRKANNGTRW